jgi:hypothetical protein
MQTLADTSLFSNLAAANRNETFLSQVTYAFEGSVPISPRASSVGLPKAKIHRGGACRLLPPFARFLFTVCCLLERHKHDEAR